MFAEMWSKTLDPIKMYSSGHHWLIELWRGPSVHLSPVEGPETHPSVWYHSPRHQTKQFPLQQGQQNVSGHMAVVFFNFRNTEWAHHIWRFYWFPCLKCVCVCRYALVDFGLAQGTADTQIELLKVVRQRSSQKGGGSTGKLDTTQRSKAPPRLPPKTTTTASTSLPHPPQQSTTLPPSSSSSSTTTSSSASRKALVKKARSVTTATSRTKHTKVSALCQYFTFYWCLSLFFVQWKQNCKLA